MKFRFKKTEQLQTL